LSHVGYIGFANWTSSTGIDDYVARCATPVITVGVDGLPSDG